MKAEELMIDDWVQIRHPKGLPDANGIQISEIDSSGNSICFFSDIAEGELTLSLDDIAPIPITPEILEKNGFGYIKHDGEELTHFYPGKPQFCRDMDLHIGTDNKGHYWLNYRANDIYGIRSVHELQHAFRLCKIEQEIIL